ncbi:MAG TPA: hypothetical protein VE031_08530 [Chthoniobacterales bacterium]|nr:hypothetical protein [Chthoniobacterales bacterium]
MTYSFFASGKPGYRATTNSRWKIEPMLETRGLTEHPAELHDNPSGSGL